MTTLATDKNHTSNGSRRDFLYVATGTAATVGAALAVWPLIDQMNPSEDVLALASTEIDLTSIAIGQAITIVWRGKPVFVRRRTSEEISSATHANLEELPDPQLDSERVQRAEWLVLVGICTHLGCIPLGQKGTHPRGEWGGWFCPCHGSHYDTSGRVRKGPAPQNLSVPPYEFITDTTIRIG